MKRKLQADALCDQGWGHGTTRREYRSVKPNEPAQGCEQCECGDGVDEGTKLERAAEES